MTSIGEFKVDFELYKIGDTLKQLDNFDKRLNELEKHVKDMEKQIKESNKEIDKSFINFKNVAVAAFSALYYQAMKVSPAIQAHMIGIRIAFEEVGWAVGDALEPLFVIFEDMAFAFSDWFLGLDESTQRAISLGAAIVVATVALKKFIPSNWGDTMTSLKSNFGVLKKAAGIIIAIKFADDAFDAFQQGNILEGIENSFKAGAGLALVAGKGKTAGALFMVGVGMDLITKGLNQQAVTWKDSLGVAFEGAFAGYLFTGTITGAFKGIGIGLGLVFVSSAIKSAIEGDFQKMVMSSLIAIGFIFPNPITLAGATIGMTILLKPDLTEFFAGLPGSENIRKHIWGESGTMQGWLSEKYSTDNILNPPTTQPEIETFSGYGKGYSPSYGYGSSPKLYQAGGYISSTGLHMMHAGEQIIPSGISGEGGGISGINVTNNMVFYGGMGDKHTMAQNINDMTQTMKQSLKQYQSTSLGGRF